MFITKRQTPKFTTLPRHIAIIMDGNGRWARKRGLPRPAGHHAGVKSVRTAVEVCAKHGVQVLTLFAFSSENWQRPVTEVSALMNLFVQALDDEIESMHRNGIRVRFIGDRSSLHLELQQRMRLSEERTANNPGLILVIAMAYGGRWDITQATRKLAQRCVAGELAPGDIDEARIGEHVELAGLPEPDLFIRTGGEQRISNFLLWSLAYTELYFCDALWPQFDEKQLNLALQFFSERQRRFGLTGEQAVARNATDGEAD
ncbi:MAG TPA: polyprenyl diphosphate synthase [Steroidobacteraceae bacterium]|nr:polyprenyl diphosphate synthase [Steroidobacteraceae bacterium]